MRAPWAFVDGTDLFALVEALAWLGDQRPQNHGSLAGATSECTSLCTLRTGSGCMESDT
ncbi:hypothetical protein [Streptomyces fagopyri]|uniref:hypothetical protein n=1 Tax=Streptomyces fagopyri TaxID=2662397 RepID=UPI00340219BD